MRRIYKAFYFAIILWSVRRFIELIRGTSDDILDHRIRNPSSDVIPLIMKFKENEFYIPGVVPRKCEEPVLINDAWLLAEKTQLKGPFSGCYCEKTNEARKKTPPYLTEAFKEGARAIVAKAGGIVLD